MKAKAKIKAGQLTDLRRQLKFESVVGPLFIVASEKGLQGIFWEEQKVKFLDSLNEKQSSVAYISQTVIQLNEYFMKIRKKFDINLDVAGTDFQIRVWNELSKIPYGKTVSYKDVAERLDSKAVRAVGSANGRNPIMIIVPCHRVINASGGLGGYAGGLEAKKKLLQLEQN